MLYVGLFPAIMVHTFYKFVSNSEDKSHSLIYFGVFLNRDLVENVLTQSV